MRNSCKKLEQSVNLLKKNILSVVASVVDPKLFITDPDPTFQKVPVAEPTFFLMKYDFKGPKMAFQNISFKEYLNLVPGT
jgi:hypothetical protein